MIYASKWHRACRHQLCSSEGNGWTAWGCFPCTHHVPLKGLGCIYNSDRRAGPNNGGALSFPYMVKYDNGTLPPNLWSAQVEECRSGDVGLFHPREDIRLILLAKDLWDQVEQHACLLRLFFFFFLILKNKHFCSSLKYQHFLKPKNMPSSPHVSEKEIKKARIKTNRKSPSRIYTLQP